MTPFANPFGVWALFLIPALILFALAMRIKGQREAARWGGKANVRALSILPVPELDFLRRACLWGALLLAAGAFARPQWGEVAETIQKTGLDVVLLMDTSRSMAVKDIAPSRLDRARLEAKSFLAADQGDRVGLVAFAGVPVTLSPLTEDSAAIAMLLDISDPDLIPAQGTDIGKAIAEAIRLFPQPHDRDQVILLFTDGEDQGTDAVAAARTAARLGIRIFCVGVGTAAGGPVPGLNGQPMTDPSTGAPAVSRLDAKTLSQIAAISDGRYWTLAGSGSVVPQIVEELGHLKRKEYASRSQAMRQDQFTWFLVPALCMLLFALALPDRRGFLSPAPPDQRRSGRGTLAIALLCLALAGTAFHAQSVQSLAESARTAYASGRLETALGLYQKALQQAPSSALKYRLHFNAGTCFLALKRPQDAVNELSLAMAGSDPVVKERALYNLAQAFYAGNDRERALSSLRALLIDDPTNRDAQLLYEWILRQSPPKQPPPPPEQPPPQTKPPDVLEQLPMPPAKELQDQVRPPDTPRPGMKPW